MGYVKWSLFLLAIQNLWSSKREDTGRSPAPVVEDIDKLDDGTKDKLFFLIDNVVQNSKAKKAFAS